MGWLAARLFTRLQAAAFYRHLHETAVEALPPGDGRPWIDVGCGPGLIPRLAAARGYTAVGIDRDPSMVAAAGRQTRPGCSFLTGGLDSLEPGTAAVVSASSLLAVLPDPRAGLARLWDAVSPGGTLLIIEASPAMTLAHARAYNARHAHPSLLLLLWAFMRQNRTVDRRLLDHLHPMSLPLLGGMVGAHVCRKDGSAPP